MRKLILLGAMLSIGLTLTPPAADAQIRVVVGPHRHHWHHWHHHWHHWHRGY